MRCLFWQLVFTDYENRWKKAYLLNRAQCGTKKDFDAASEIMEDIVLTVDVGELIYSGYSYRSTMI